MMSTELYTLMDVKHKFWVIFRRSFPKWFFILVKGDNFDALLPSFNKLEWGNFKIAFHFGCGSVRSSYPTGFFLALKLNIL